MKYFVFEWNINNKNMIINSNILLNFSNDIHVIYKEIIRFFFWVIKILTEHTRDRPS